MKPAPKKVILLAAAWPMRINKYLAHKGYSTRRGADELVMAQKVLLNGHVAVLGDKVKETDVVEVLQAQNKTDGNSTGKKAPGTGSGNVHGTTAADRVYFIFNKPAGMSASDEEINTVIEQLKSQKKNAHLAGKKLFPIGRLDKESSGIMILTNDGRITDRLLNPVYAHPKTFFCTLNKPHSASFIRIMSDRLLNLQAGPENAAETVDPLHFKVTLNNTGNAHLEHIAAELGFIIVESQRIAILNIALGNLKPGEMREVTEKECKTFLHSLGL